MRKELFIAIFLGSFLGLAIAFGAWRFSNSLNKPTIAVDNNLAQETGADSQGQQKEVVTHTGSFTITRPSDNYVSSSSEVEIAGIAQEKSNLLIAAQNNDFLQSNNGTFQKEIKLADGINQVSVYMFTQNGEVEQKSIQVISLDGIESGEGYKSITGTITDITENTIQIRTSTGEISQVAVSESTSYVSTIQNNKDIEFEDLAIGDFVASIGKVDEDEVIAATNVIVSIPSKETTKEVAYGSIETLSRNDFIVKNDTTDKVWSVDATKSPKVTTLNEDGEIVTARLTSSAEEGDWIVIIGEMKDDELVANAIHIL